MAEQEIAKHGKQVIRLMTSKEHGISHKLREIAIEFATILFAVLLSIWLHGWSEHRHQQHEVRTFLAGLKHDLQTDIANLEGAKKAYKDFDERRLYLLALDPGAAPDQATFDTAYRRVYDMNWFFIPSKSRYEGFMMSGKLTNIEDPELSSAILNLYQNLLQQVQTSEGGWANRQRKLRDHRDEVLDGDDPASRLRLVTSPKGRRMVAQLVTAGQHYQRYEDYAEQARQIIKRIDAYPGMADEGA